MTDAIVLHRGGATRSPSRNPWGGGLARIMRPRSPMTSKPMSQKAFCELPETGESTLCRFATVRENTRKALCPKDSTSFEPKTHE